MDSEIKAALLEIARGQEALLKILSEDSPETPKPSLDKSTASSLLFGKPKAQTLAEPVPGKNQQVLFKTFEISLKHQDTSSPIPSGPNQQAYQLIAMVNAPDLGKTREEIEQEKAEAVSKYLNQGWKLFSLKDEKFSNAGVWVLTVVYVK